jgi:ubiquinone/menaquinone biosynthesis C-methylase UbiE
MDKNFKINTAGLSTEKILLAVYREARRCFTFSSQTINYLDVGAGNGELIKLIGSQIETKPYACDYTDGLMELDGQTVEICDLNVEELPYGDNTFDLVTFTEVIEHIENHRFTLSEIARVLKPGGYVILSTPNILNLKSRIRFLFCGFWNLFGPLKIGDRKLESTGGHINPIHYFYIAHSLMEARLKVVRNSYDKIQTSSFMWMLLFCIPIKICSSFHLRKEKSKWKTVDSQNEEFVVKSNSLTMMLSRTVVVTAQKPDTSL